MTSLSIVIPVYNVLPYIELCLNSIISQMGDDVEIIVVDDASTDGSMDQARLLLGTLDPDRWKIIRHDRNKGLSAARNTGMEAAQGEYIWFIDSDDALVSGSISKVLSLVPGLDVLAFDYLDMYESLRFTNDLDDPSTIEQKQHFEFFPVMPRTLLAGKHEISPLEIATSLVADVRTYAWSFVVRREICKTAPFLEGRYYEDVSTIPVWLLRAQEIYYLPLPMIAYRRRDGSITWKPNSSKLFDLANAYGLAIHQLKLTDPDIYAQTQTILSAGWLQMLSWASRDLMLNGHLSSRATRTELQKSLGELRREIGAKRIEALRYLFKLRGKKEGILGTLLVLSPSLFFLAHRLLRNKIFRRLVLWRP